MGRFHFGILYLRWGNLVLRAGGKRGRYELYFARKFHVPIDSRKWDIGPLRRMGGHASYARKAALKRWLISRIIDACWSCVLRAKSVIRLILLGEWRFDAGDMWPLSALGRARRQYLHGGIRARILLRSEHAHRPGHPLRSPLVSWSARRPAYIRGAYYVVAFGRVCPSQRDLAYRLIPRPGFPNSRFGRGLVNSDGGPAPSWPHAPGHSADESIRLEEAPAPGLRGAPKRRIAHFPNFFAPLWNWGATFGDGQ